MIKRRAKQAKLPNWRSLGNHSFRASGLTDYMKRGGNIEYAQFMAGHKDVRTTRLCNRVNQEESLEEIERIQLFSPPKSELEPTSE